MIKHGRVKKDIRPRVTQAVLADKIQPKLVDIRPLRSH